MDSGEWIWDGFSKMDYMKISRKWILRNGFHKKLALKWIPQKKIAGPYIISRVKWIPLNGF